MRKRVTIKEPAVVYSITNYWSQLTSSSDRTLGGADPPSSENPTIPDTISAESVYSEGNSNSNADAAITPEAVGHSDKEEPLGLDEVDEVTNEVHSAEGVPTSEDDDGAGEDSRLGTSLHVGSSETAPPAADGGSSETAPPAEDDVCYCVSINETVEVLEWPPAAEERDFVENSVRVSFPETDVRSGSLESDGITQRVECDSVRETPSRGDQDLEAIIPLETTAEPCGGLSFGSDDVNDIVFDALTFRSSAGATSRSSGGTSPRGSTKRPTTSSLRESKKVSLAIKASVTETDKVRSSEENTETKKTKRKRRCIDEVPPSSETEQVCQVCQECQECQECQQNNARVIKFDPEKPFSDDCVRFKECCPCCHCAAVRCAIKKASFYLTPQGQRQLQAQRDMKNFFMDINAMSEVRWRIEAKLHGRKDPFPSPQKGFPICLTEVKRLDKMCLCLTWYIHDNDNIKHYEICVDGRHKKIVHDPQQTKTILVDVNATCNHKIIMRAVPKTGGKSAQADRLVQILCCEGGLQHAFSCKEDPSKQAQDCGPGKDERKNLLEFWRPSQFFYMPQCKCQDECDCDWND